MSPSVTTATKSMLPLTSWRPNTGVYRECGRRCAVSRVMRLLRSMGMLDVRRKRAMADQQVDQQTSRRLLVFLHADYAGKVAAAPCSNALCSQLISMLFGAGATRGGWPRR